jgi:hypothetical protein
MMNAFYEEALPGLSAERLVAAWERSGSEPRSDDAATALVADLSGRDPEAVASMPLGRRNAALLAIRRRVLGSDISAFTTCPGCGARLDFGISGDLMEELAQPIEAQEHSFQDEGFELRFRLPSSADLYAVAACDSPEQGRELLIDRCVIECRYDGDVVQPDVLPDAVIEALGERMQALDPLAETLFHLTCPDCGLAWEACLDLAAFVWTEVGVYARRLLGEVHALASAYGWREAEIMAMSPRRRRAYMEMLG